MLLLALASLAVSNRLTPINHRALPHSRSEFTFIALGDNRPAGAGLPPTSTFKEILKEVSLIDPAFVICSGDLLYGNDDTLDQYKQEIAWMKPLLESLPCPFFNSPGNHEIHNDPRFLAAYSRAMAPPYGEFDYGGYRFLAVCTELPAQRPGVYGQELVWLKNALSISKPTITFQHHPVFPRTTNPDPPEDKMVSGAAALHQLYRSGGVKLAFEAHDHVFNDQNHDGIRYVISGNAGAPLDALSTDGGYFGYSIVHIDGDTIDLTPISLDALEVVPIAEGEVAVGEYSDVDIPIGNLKLQCKRRPSVVKAWYQTKKRKVKRVEARIVKIERVGGGYEAQVAFVAPKHHATFVELTY